MSAGKKGNTHSKRGENTLKHENMGDNECTRSSTEEPQRKKLRVTEQAPAERGGVDKVATQETISASSDNQIDHDLKNKEHIKRLNPDQSQRNANDSSQLQDSRVSIPGNFVEASDLKASVGDLIEIDRGIYKHWVLYFGQGMVIHVTGPNNEITVEEAEVKKMSLIEVAGESLVRTNNLEQQAKNQGLSAFAPSTAVQNGMKHLGKKVPYNVLSKNCEHYVTKWKYGKEWSGQATTAMMMLKAMSGFSASHTPPTNGRTHTHNADAPSPSKKSENCERNVPSSQNSGINLLSLFANVVKNVESKESESGN